MTMVLLTVLSLAASGAWQVGVLPTQDLSGATGGTKG